MGVSVSGHVEGGSVVVAGDTVTVSVTVTAAPNNNNGQECNCLPPDDSSGEVVSWCSAQIHCICTTNETYVIPPKTDESAATATTPQPQPGTPGTSFAPWRGENGHLVLTTKPSILFCDLLLQPGHSKTFLYRETVPVSAPPSYRGHHVKYSWKVTVGAQRHGDKIQLIRLPLRVMLLPQPAPGVLESAYSESEEELSPSNPFLHPSTPPPTSPPSSLLQAWPSRSARAYNIAHSRGHVVKFSIFRNIYRLGDDIMATLDFTQGQIPCVQYSVCLQSVEEINEDHRRRSRQSPSVVSYSKTHELCLSMTHSSLLLPVPLHVTPAFDVQMVSLQYRLHFEFVLSLNDSNRRSAKPAVAVSKAKSSGSEASTPHSSVSSDGGSTPTSVPSNTAGVHNIYDDGTWESLSDGSTFWRPPTELAIETLVWDLPVTVGPAPPAHLAAALNLPDSAAEMVV